MIQMNTTTLTRALALSSLVVAAASCLRAPSGDGFSLRLPDKVRALSAEDAAALHATLEIGDGVLDETDLVISDDRSEATGTFTLENVKKKGTHPFTLRLRYQPDEDTDVLLGRLEGDIVLQPNKDNKLTPEGEFDTCGAVEPGGPCALILDLNRNGAPNLDDLVAGFDPRPPPPFVDVAPSDLAFPSGIRLGTFSRQVIVVENSSAHPVNVKATLIDAPGATLQPFETEPSSESGARRSLDLGELAPFEERLVAVSFAPVNPFLAVGDIFVEATDPATRVSQATRVRLLANVDGELQPPPAGFAVDPIGAGADLAGFDGPIDSFSTTSLFNGLPISSVASDAGSIAGLPFTGKTITATFTDEDGATSKAQVPADHAFIVDVPVDHKLAVSLSGLESDIDLSLFLLDENDSITAEPNKNFRRSTVGTSAEALEIENAVSGTQRALVVLGRNELAGPAETEGGLTADEPAPFSLSVHVTSAPEFTAPLDPPGGPLEGGTRVQLRGKRFHPGARVTFADTVGLDCIPSVDGEETLFDCTAPPGSLAVGKNPATIVVANPPADEGGDGQAATLPEGFTYEPPAPRLDSVQPAVAPISGSTGVITLRGAFFTQKNGAPQVLFDGAPIAGVTFVDSTRLEVTAPAHDAGIVVVSVRNILDPQPGDSGPRFSLESNARNFTYVTPDNPAPTVTGVEPLTGSVDGGETIGISGTGFLDGATVVIDGEAATNVVVNSPTSITCRTPAHNGPGIVDVEVVNFDGQRGAATAAFTYFVPSPTVVSAFPDTSSTGGGTFVVVTGSGFRAGVKVEFVQGSIVIPSPNVNRVSATTLLVATPQVSVDGEYSVKVTNLDGQTATTDGGFHFLTPTGPAPRIDSISPNAGNKDVPQQVTLTGGDFRNPVVIAGTAAAEIVSSDTAGDVDTVTFVMPALAAPGPIVVRVINDDGQSDTTIYTAFTVLGTPPSITSLSPASGAKGTSLTITGRSFDVVDDGLGGTTLAPNARVLIGGVLVTQLTSLSATSMTFTVPDLDALVGGQSGAVAVEITNSDGQTTSAVFSYVVNNQAAPPRITGLSRSVARVGDAVTISGTGFNLASLEVGDVALPANSPSITQRTATSIAFTVPAPGASLPLAATVSVVNVDGQRAQASLTIVADPPVITSITPESVDLAGGGVTLRGTGFSPQATITVDGAAQNGATVTATQATFTVASRASAGLVAVRLTNPDGQSDAVSLSYTQAPPATVTPPRIDSIAPTSVPLAGNVQVTLTGAGFATSGGVLTVGGVNVTPQSVTATQVRFLAPARAAAGLAVVRFTNPGNVFDQALLDYVAGGAAGPGPSIISITPDTSPTAGGVLVAVNGAGFDTTSGKVFVGGAQVAATFQGSGVVTFNAPAHAAGTVSVVVQNGDGQSASTALRFADNAGGVVDPQVAVIFGEDVHAGVPGDVVTLFGRDLVGITSVTIEDTAGAPVGNAIVQGGSGSAVNVEIRSPLPATSAPNALPLVFKLTFSDGSTRTSPPFQTFLPILNAAFGAPGDQFILGDHLNAARLVAVRLDDGAGSVLAVPVVGTTSETTIRLGSAGAGIPGATYNLSFVYRDVVAQTDVVIRPEGNPSILQRTEQPLPAFLVATSAVHPAGDNLAGRTVVVNVALDGQNPAFGSPAGFDLRDVNDVTVASGTWTIARPGRAVGVFGATAPVTAGFYQVVLKTTASPQIARSSFEVPVAPREINTLSTSHAASGGPLAGAGTIFTNDVIVLEDVATGIAVDAGSATVAGCVPAESGCGFASAFQLASTPALPNGSYRVCSVAATAPVDCPDTLGAVLVIDGLTRTSFTNQQCANVSTSSVTGPLRGNVAATSSTVYATGFAGTALTPSSLGAVASAPPVQSLFADPSTGRVFHLRNNVGGELSRTSGPFTIEVLEQLTPDTLVPAAPPIQVSPPVTVTAGLSNGLFVGNGFIVIFAAANFGEQGTWTRIDLATGASQVIAQSFQPSFRPCFDGWAAYGTATVKNGQTLVAFANGGGIGQLNLATQAQQQLASFPDFNSVCGIAELPQQQRWYFASDGFLNLDGRAVSGRRIGSCAASSCGDGVCGSGEDDKSCPEDCAIVCGDGTCETPFESTLSCAADCVATCGDAVCNGNENPESCAQDCTPQCNNNGFCEPQLGESAASCPNDCVPQTCNNNGICQTFLGESEASCFADCGSG